MGLWDIICAIDGFIAESAIENYKTLERKSRCGRLTEEEEAKLQHYRETDYLSKNQQILDYVNSRKNRDR